MTKEETKRHFVILRGKELITSREIMLLDNLLQSFAFVHLEITNFEIKSDEGEKRSEYERNDAMMQ